MGKRTRRKLRCGGGELSFDPCWNHELNRTACEAEHEEGEDEDLKLDTKRKKPLQKLEKIANIFNGRIFLEADIFVPSRTRNKRSGTFAH